MAVFEVPDIRLCGVSASVPKYTADNKDYPGFQPHESDLFIKTVGIRYRKLVSDDITAADLCESAARKLLEDLKWKPDNVDVLVFITQTPDYIIPNTASLLQIKLGLPKSCIAFDVNLGCSGYVYGLSIVGSLLRNMKGAKALLLVGDVSSRIISKNDKSTTPLFSDAGSATALENKPGHSVWFNLETDGKEYDDIMVPDGGFRNFFSPDSLIIKEYEKGILRSNLDMKLDGLKIFNFALREVAPNINKLMETIGKATSEADYVVFHQANLLMLESVRKKMKIEAEKVPYSLYNYGNTSSASIPVTMVTNLRQQLIQSDVNLLLSGFGVGLSWGSAYFKTDKIVCPELIEI